MPKVFLPASVGNELLIHLVKQGLINRKRDARPGLAIGLGGEAVVADVANLAARNIAAQDLLHEQGHGGGRVEFSVAPRVVVFATNALDELRRKKLQRIVFDAFQ